MTRRAAAGIPRVQLTRADDNCVGVVTLSVLTATDAPSVVDAAPRVARVVGVAVSDIERARFTVAP